MKAQYGISASPRKRKQPKPKPLENIGKDAALVKTLRNLGLMRPVTKN